MSAKASKPTTPTTVAEPTLAERAKLAYQGLLTVLDSYSSKGYIDTGAHDVFVGTVREMGKIAEALESVASAREGEELARVRAKIEEKRRYWESHARTARECQDSTSEVMCWAREGELRTILAEIDATTRAKEDV